jgi:hypothetical protein
MREDLSLEEKVDLLLKYQRRQQHMAIAGALFKLVLLFVFVILPIIWAVQFVNTFKDSPEFAKFQQTIQELQSSAGKLDDAAAALKKLPQAPQ